VREVKLAKLSLKMSENRYTHSLIAQNIGLTPSAMSSRMNKKTEWSLIEMCKVMDILKIPYSQIKEYFN